jgi:hypothetical protein
METDSLFRLMGICISQYVAGEKGVSPHFSGFK